MSATAVHHWAITLQRQVGRILSIQQALTYHSNDATVCILCTGVDTLGDRVSRENDVET